MAALLAAPWRAGAQSIPQALRSLPRALEPIPAAPKISPSQAGASIEEVRIETSGVIEPDAVRRYLSLRKGSLLEQAAVNRDYNNLVRLGGFRPHLLIAKGSNANAVTLHWSVLAEWLQPVVRSFYADQPLSPIPGVGLGARSPPIDDRGTNFFAYGLTNGPSNLARLLLTTPLHVDPVGGREADFGADVFGGQGVYRASQPLAINVYSWTAGTEALYLLRATNGTQFELALRQLHSTNAEPSGIVAPSIYSTYQAPARNTLLEAGIAHNCSGAAAPLYPPYCEMQYRFEVLDGIGWLGATNEYQVYVADVARYIAVGPSTLAFHVAAARTGGVLPDSFLVCGSARAYPKAFCGTDAQTLTAEYRANDALPQKLKVVFFAETAASRVREGEQPWALPTFQWHAGSGMGIVYGGLVRLDLAYGSQGARLWFGVKECETQPGASVGVISECAAYRSENALQQLDLRLHRNVFADGHRAGARDETGKPGELHDLRIGRPARDAEDERDIGDQTIVDAEDRSPDAPVSACSATLVKFTVGTFRPRLWARAAASQCSRCC